ncbi:hypothetical protein [Clostridium sp. HCS.1]|uniref:hypothetical protein n=1 Tax=Clostridium sp. HCS.1 TaxID=3238594 RepID=UPI003A0FE8E3
MKTNKDSRKRWMRIEIVGLALVVISFLTLLISPESISGDSPTLAMAQLIHPLIPKIGHGCIFII